MKLYKKILAIALFISGLSYLNAVEPAQNQVDFNIRFFDRQIYYVRTSPILVQITITNNSPNPFRFKLADERVFSVDFDVRSMTNRQLPEADTLKRKRTQNQQVFFREIAIETGESFSFVEDLRDFVEFSQPGSYRVKAVIYPELFRQAAALPAAPSVSLESNYLTLSIRPELIQGPDGIPLEMDIATGAALVKQNLPPDEVVKYMITARQQSQWERFFLYLDLEAMLSRDALRKRRWQAETEEGRRNMVRIYREELQKAQIDGDISVIPTEFEILRTVYSQNEGQVIALLKFRNPTFTELKRYTYYLEKKDNFWVIVNYGVEGLGTE